MEWEQLAEILNAAIARFNEQDRGLLEDKSHQQSYCAKLADQLGQQIREQIIPQSGLPPLPSYSVDVEYNRDRHTKAKRLLREWMNKTKKSPVRPDLIVHQRGPDGPNLLVVEVGRKANSDDARTVCDFWKLAALVQDFGYQFGLYLCFSTGVGNPGEIQEAWLLEREKLMRTDEGERKRYISGLSLTYDVLKNHNPKFRRDYRYDKDKPAFVADVDDKRESRELRGKLGFQKLDSKTLLRVSA